MMKGGNKMKLTRIETAELLEVSEKYLCPSNFHSVQEGAKEKGILGILLSLFKYCSLTLSFTILISVICGIFFKPKDK